MNQKNNSNDKKLAIIIVIIAVIIAWLFSCSGHAPGYGDTGKCTICGKTATHHSSNYGYCDEHWKDATGQ